MSQPNQDSQRREIRFFGRVQGVGFRYTVREIAARFPVRGFVKNLRDGSVLLVAEGAAGPLDGLQAEVENEMDRFIQQRQVTMLPATGEFSSFEIQH